MVRDVLLRNSAHVGVVCSARVVRCQRVGMELLMLTPRRRRRI